VSAEYFHGPQRIGRYSALLADIVDFDGELVTAHVTYLDAGKKLELADPESTCADPRTLPARKILSKMDGRIGCAVRLMPAADVLGIAEGIETALSAAVIDGLPVWAALNTSLLAKFEPPPQTQRLVVYADNDAPGLMAACRLMERMQARIRDGMAVEFRPPPSPAKDWNDTLISRSRGSCGEGINP
jgi:putative DNA primase/helicase